MDRNEAEVYVGLAESVLRLAELQTASLKVLSAQLEAIKQAQRSGDPSAKAGTAEPSAQGKAPVSRGPSNDLSSAVARLESHQEQLDASLAGIKASLRQIP